MSFWDHLKPAARAPVATAAHLEMEGASLALQWDDGLQTRLPFRRLRQGCPCAECVEEWTGRRTLDPESVPAGIQVLEMQPVGNYALQFAFSDGHRTGIYTWAALRALGEAS